MDEKTKKDIEKAALKYAQPEAKHYGELVASHPRVACTGVELQDNDATMRRYNARQLFDAKVDQFLNDPNLNGTGKKIGTEAPKTQKDEGLGYRIKNDVIAHVEQSAIAQVVPRIQKAKGCDSGRGS